MKYMLMMNAPRGTGDWQINNWSPEDFQAHIAFMRRFNKALTEAGELAPQVIGAVARRHGDFAAAEDAVQEALIAAATQWPVAGVPDNPRGWLYQVAVRRLTDHIRSETSRRRREDVVASELSRDEP